MDAIHVSLEEFFSKRLVFKKKTRNMSTGMFLFCFYFILLLLLLFFLGGDVTHVRDHF